MAEPLGEREVETVVVGPAIEQLEVHRAPRRERSRRDVRERDVRSGRPVVREVGVYRGARLLASAAGVGVVDLQRRLRADLPLHPDGRLMRIGGLAARVVDLLRQRAERAVGRAVDDVAGVLERLLEAWLRAVEPAEEVIADSREVVAAIERNLVLEAVQVALGLLYAVVGCKGIEQPVPTTDGRLVVHLIGKSGTRCEVGLFNRQTAWQPRPEHRLLVVAVGIEVVAKTKIEGQPARHAPVVLQPGAPHMPEDVIPMLGIRRGY